MKRLLILLVLASAVACDPYNIEEVLLPKDDISFTMRGVDQFTYDPLTWQISQNVTANEFRVFDDKLSQWFTIKCDAMPTSEGQTLTAELSWTAVSSTRVMKDLNFKVEKTDNSGKIWMWCEQKSIGIVIKNL